jgi:4-amino-4-deoxychorismate lyase
VFIIKDGELFTPELDQCGVNGIIHEQILLIAKKIDINSHIKIISLDEMHLADEIFITNSIIGLWPVGSVGEIRYPVGDITRSFETELFRRIRNNAKSFS